MSLVSSGVGRPHLCTIQRDMAEPDRFGATTTPDWQDHLTGLVCWAWQNNARNDADVDRDAELNDRRVSVPLGTDVTNADRVNVVTDRAGNTVMDGPMRIDAVLRFGDHLELALERVR